LVAPEGTETFAPASSFPELADFFEAPEPQVLPVSSLALARRDGSEAARAQFIVVAQMRPGSVAAFEQELIGFGPTLTVLPHVWVLSATVSLNALRNALVQKLGRLDILFLVDTTHDKAAWFNLGPEAEARIRRIWMTAQDKPFLNATPVDTRV
jgi:hypothetical protein